MKIECRECGRIITNVMPLRKFGTETFDCDCGTLLGKVVSKVVVFEKGKLTMPLDGELD